MRDNLKKAKPGDYIVTAQNKTYTLLHIQDKEDDLLTMEEITVPSSKISKNNQNWKNWVACYAPGHTSWVKYVIQLSTGEMKEYFSYSKNAWYQIPKADNFLSTLLNLHFVQIPLNARKKVGPIPSGGGPDFRTVWQPQMVVDGREIQGVFFDAWKTHWPKDGSEMSGRTIEVFVPAENERYPAYFPYWLQISGMVGKAKIRIIDSGTGLITPKRS